MTPLLNKAVLVASGAFDIYITYLTVKYLKVGIATDNSDLVAWSGAILVGIVVMAYLFESDVERFDKNAEKY